MGKKKKKSNRNSWIKHTCATPLFIKRGEDVNELICAVELNNNETILKQDFI